MKKEFWTGFILVLLLAFSASIAVADVTDLDGEYLWNHHAAPYDYKFGNMIDSHQQSIVDKTGTSLKGFIYIHNINDDYAEGIPTADKAHCKTQPCMVGWLVKGVKVSAKLMQKSPRIWLVAPEDLPKEPGYTHFHWVGSPKSPHDLVVGETYPGFLMKRIAPAPFFWLGGPGTGGSGGGGGGGCDGGTQDEGGCSGGGTHDDGGCSGGGTDTTHTDGGRTDTTHTDGGCTDGGTHDDGGCSDSSHDDGGCSGGGGSGGTHDGGSGRLVNEGVDSHSNIITDENQLGGHGGCHDD
ncbi:MAG: hypothetical protein P8Y68_08790 [Anaerolineales bacterium]